MIPTHPIKKVVGVLAGACLACSGTVAPAVAAPESLLPAQVQQFLPGAEQSSQVAEQLGSTGLAETLGQGELPALTPAAAESNSDAAGPVQEEPVQEVPFHWGVATAGFQIEGSNRDSNWSRYASEDRQDGDKHIDGVRNAVDFRHRYAEDIANAASLGVNTFRLSIEWSRIEPEPGHFDMEEVAYYDDVLRLIREHGMTPMITMIHYVYPGWIVDQGGILSQQAQDAFARYAAFITDRWGGDGTMWVTLNEPFVWFGHDVEIHLAERTQLPEYLDMIVNFNRIGYEAAHAKDPNALSGTNFAFLPTIAPVQRALLFERLNPHMDYAGIDYYYSVSATNLSAIHAAFADFAAVTPEPEGIYYATRQYAQQFPGKPIYIVENGQPTDNAQPRADGYPREQFLHDTIYWIQRAIADGVPIIGYNHWSLVDNYEWGDYSARFGLWTVDVKNDPTLTRHATPAVEEYRRIIANGGAEGPLYRQPAVCSFAALPESCLSPAAVDGPTVKLR